MNRVPKTPLPLKIDVGQWVDPTSESTGSQLRSMYFETYWLPVLGPSATMLARRLDLYVYAPTKQHKWTTIDTLDLAVSLGLKPDLGTYSAFCRSFRRLMEFDVMRPVERTSHAFEIRSHMPPLPVTRYDRLPEFLRRSLSA